MRALANISNLCRVLLGVVLACGLLLLPPSSAHAQNGMHNSTQETHHGVHQASHKMPLAAAVQQDAAALPHHTEAPESFEGDPCCGGICLTMALSSTQYVKVTSVQSVDFIRISQSAISADAAGQLRPPRV